MIRAMDGHVDENVFERGGKRCAGAVDVVDRAIEILVTRLRDVPSKSFGVRANQLAACIESERRPDGDLGRHTFDPGEPDFLRAEDMGEVWKRLRVTFRRVLERLEHVPVRPLYVSVKFVKVAMHNESVRADVRTRRDAVVPRPETSPPKWLS